MVESANQTNNNGVPHKDSSLWKTKKRRSSNTESSKLEDDETNKKSSTYHNKNQGTNTINNKNTTANNASVNKNLSSSSVFISSLSHNNSFSKKPRSFKAKNKKTKNKNYNGKDSDNKNVSLHAYNIDQLKSTFHTSEDNIIRPKHKAHTKTNKSFQNPFNFASVPQGKHLYTNFHGDSIYYSTVIKPANFEKLISMDRKEHKRSFYWPFGDNKPCPVKFEYYVKNGKIAAPINCYFLESEEPDAESINFKSCENKDLSIYFLLRILAADYDLIDRIVSNLSHVSAHILKQIILSILKGWNIYLVCDVDLIRRCVDVFYKLRGFKMYYLNRPIITVIGFQNALSCKNCYRFAESVDEQEEQEEGEEVEEGRRNAEDAEVSQEPEVSQEQEESHKLNESESEVSINSTVDSDDDSEIMEIILSESEKSESIKNEDIIMDELDSIDPRGMALEYLSQF